MKFWLTSFVVLVAFASFSQAVPVRVAAVNDNQVNEEMMRGKLFDLDVSFNSYLRTCIDGLFIRTRP